MMCSLYIIPFNHKLITNSVHSISSEHSWVCIPDVIVMCNNPWEKTKCFVIVTDGAKRGKNPFSYHLQSHTHTYTHLHFDTHEHMYSAHTHIQPRGVWPIRMPEPSVHTLTHTGPHYVGVRSVWLKTSGVGRLHLPIHLWTLWFPNKTVTVYALSLAPVVLQM